MKRPSPPAASLLRLPLMTRSQIEASWEEQRKISGGDQRKLMKSQIDGSGIRITAGRPVVYVSSATGGRPCVEVSLSKMHASSYFTV